MLQKGEKKTMYISVKDKIKSLIIRRGRGRFWFIGDFAMFENASVKNALRHLSNEEMLIRIANGVYYYPKIDRELGLGPLLPSKEETAKAIAKHHRLKIAPTGVFALNALGLTMQMQTVVAFLTNGRARRINLGNGRYIKLLHSSSQKMFDYSSYTMILIIQAMLELGEQHITDSVRQKLAEHLKQVSERDFLHDLTIAPIWAQEILRTLYETH